MTLTIEQVATLQAEMDAGARAEEVLTRAGLAQGDYLTDKELHLRAIADELRGGRSALLQAYQRAFLAASQRFAAAARAALESTPETPALGAAAQKKEAAESPKFVPSYLRAGAAAAGPAAPVEAIFQAPLSQAPLSQAPLSQAPLSQAPLSAGPVGVPSSAPRSVLGKVTMMSDSVVRGPATPFRSVAGSSVPAAQGVTSPSTIPSPPSVRSAPPASVANAPMMTMAVDGEAAKALVASMPFQAKSARSATPAPQSAVRLDTGTVAASGVASSPSGTVAVDAMPMAAQPLSHEDIRRHASAQADLKRVRQPRELILSSWGFTAESMAELDARWKQQFISDGEARSLWMSIYSARLSSG